MNADHACPQAEQAIGLGLHALEPADEDLLSEHVPHCQICQELIRQTQDVVWGLAAADEPRDPPPELRGALMARVAATEQLPPGERERPWNAGPPGGADRGGAAYQGVRRSRAGDAAAGKRSSRWLGRRRLLVVATVMVGALGVGGVAIELIGKAHQEQQAAPAELSPEVTRILADADRAGARHAVLHAPDGEVAAAVAQFSSGRQVMPIRLPANSADHTVYVLWGLGDGPARAIGTFDVSAPSETMLPVGPVGNGGQYASYAISIEQGRTVPASPGLVVASGRVQS